MSSDDGGRPGGDCEAPAEGESILGRGGQDVEGRRRAGGVPP